MKFSNMVPGNSCGFFLVCHLLFLIKTGLSIPGHYYFQTESIYPDKDSELEDFQEALLIQTQARTNDALVLKTAALEASRKAERLNEQAQIAERQAESAVHLLESLKRLASDSDQDDEDLEGSVARGLISDLETDQPPPMREGREDEQGRRVKKYMRRSAMDLLMNHRSTKRRSIVPSHPNTRLDGDQLYSPDQVALEAIRLALIQDLIRQRYRKIDRDQLRLLNANPTVLHDRSDGEDYDDDDDDDDDDSDEDPDDEDDTDFTHASLPTVRPTNIDSVESFLMKDPNNYETHNSHAALHYEKPIGRDKKAGYWMYGTDTETSMPLDPLLEE